MTEIMFFLSDFQPAVRSTDPHGQLRIALLICVLCGLCGCTGTTNYALPTDASLLAAGPVGSEGADSRRQLWMIPSSESGLLMRAVLFRPAGPGPFSLVVINHGSEQDAARRSLMPMPAFNSLTEWFLQRGYAVLLPQRPGHGETGGRYLEEQGACGSANYMRAGDSTADSIEAAVDFMARQPFVKPGRTVVVGNSAGGWGAIALASRNPAGVSALINFSGGRGGRVFNRPGKNCSPERLVATAAKYGKTTRVQTLWLYASNDSYFSPELSREMAEAFRKAGGAVDYRLLPAVGKEGHSLINAPAAVWGPYLEAFLAGTGG